MPPVTQHVRTDTAPAMLYKMTTVAAAMASLQLFERLILNNRKSFQFCLDSIVNCMVIVACDK